MTFATERYAARRDTLPFVVCVVLAIVARISPAEFTEPIASGIRGSVLAPFLFLQEYAEDLKSSRSRYFAVLVQRDSLAVRVGAQDALIEENIRLRELLDLRERISGEHVGAAVLHQSLPTDGLTLVLSAGSNQGVRPLTPVVTPAGLVGVVRSVDANASVAVIWAHPEFRASAMSLDGSVYGNVGSYEGGGRGSGLLELTGVPFRENILPGTRIYTSGHGGVYPRGIPIGEIVGVASERSGWERTYYVQPAVHPASVSHVIVLLNPEAEVGSAFGEDLE